MKLWLFKSNGKNVQCYIEGKFRLNEEYITKLFISMDNWISDKNQNFEAINWYCCTIILSPFPILEDNIHNDGVSNEQKSNQDCRQDNVCKIKKKQRLMVNLHRVEETFVFWFAILQFTFPRSTWHSELCTRTD